MSESADLAEQLSEIEADVNVPSQKIGASVWRLGPVGVLLSSVVEEHAASTAENDPNAIYFYADLEGSSELKNDDGTMQKIFQALGDQGLSERQIVDATNAMRDAGIYFREANF